MNPAVLTRELAAAVDAPVLDGDAVAPYLLDATEARGLRGRADAVVLAQTAKDVARALAWCYEHDVPLTTRGGGSGYAGGAVPDGGVVVALAALRSVRSIEPLAVARRDRERGHDARGAAARARERPLLPARSRSGRAVPARRQRGDERGRPPCLQVRRHGRLGDGLEVAIAPGELVTFGRGLRKDVAGYDIRSLLIGSEGTLGIVTAVRLKLIPPPEARRPVVAFYGDAGEGAAAVMHAMASGTLPAAIEFLDGAAFAISGRAFPLALERAERPAFVVIAEADGSEDEAATGQMLLREALSAGAEEVLTPSRPEEVAALWRWRDGMGIAADSYLGGKVSEDVCVPVDRLAEVVAATHDAAAETQLEACCWGHAGDGNVHSSFLFDGGDAAAGLRAAAAAERVFDTALSLGGSVTGEHGVGLVKSPQLRKQLSPAAADVHRAVKQLFDPKDLLNRGKKVA